MHVSHYLISQLASIHVLDRLVVTSLRIVIDPSRHWTYQRDFKGTHGYSKIEREIKESSPLF